MGFPTDPVAVPQFAATQPSVRTVGLTGLANGVRAYLASVGITASVTPVGWRQRDIHINQGPGGANRILFYPGKEPTSGSGDAGEFTRDSPTRDGARPLAAWKKLITMSVWGVDVANGNVEDAQLAATETLLERAIEAITYAIDPATGTPVGGANILWGAGRWSKPNTNAAFGQEILVEFYQLVVMRAQEPALSFPQPAPTNPEH